ncbi:hypothetical protein [Haloimpatiens massiliensis]|jgi:hypothetical protein|nr:hypothetical protein [Haloimpatiens massiliensis]
MFNLKINNTKCLNCILFKEEICAGKIFLSRKPCKKLKATKGF